MDKMNGKEFEEAAKLAQGFFDSRCKPELARQVPDGDDRVENKQMIYANIRAERARQDAKWGFPQRNSLSEWGNILGEEYGEYCKALNELVFGRTKDPGEMTDELIHVAAVAVGILEHLLMDGGIRE